MNLLSRRQMLLQSSCGFGYVALAGLCAQAQAQDAPRTDPLTPRPTHFPARAKHVIFLYMHGGPSQVDTFDYKPLLRRDHGKDLPDSLARAAGPGRNVGRPLLASPWRFRQHGQSGRWISELFPHLANQVDKMCFINGMHGDSAAHMQATRQIHTGATNFLRPTLGSWCLYGLGTENANLPGFISMHGAPGNNAFLPAYYSATPIDFAGQTRRTAGSPGIANLTNARLPAPLRQQQLEAIQELNADFLRRSEQEAGIDSVIRSFELAFRMQSAAPPVLDFSSETRATLDMYGIGQGKATDPFGRSCLLARRFVEAGVRFIEMTAPRSWDDHKDLTTSLPNNALATDQPMAALLADLERRGLLDDTLVLWGGEFGRQPMAQRENGRDHNNKGFTMWLAGGGVRGGIAHGRTDDYGYAAVADKVHIHDLHATILHLLGLDHTRLTYRYAGRDFRLTDVHGRVVHNIVA